jgi:hypothetical protein
LGQQLNCKTQLILHGVPVSRPAKRRMTQGFVMSPQPLKKS